MAPPNETRLKILAFAGSARSQSFNRRLIALAGDAASAAGADVTLINLADYPLPLYDGDLEAATGLPTPALDLKQLFNANDGLMLACPEYNSSITPLLKNTIDWVSRQAPEETPLQGFKGKVVSLFSASPGALGGLRGLVHVRAILASIGCIVLPDQLAISRAGEAFGADGKLSDAAQQQAVDNQVSGLVAMLGKLA